MWRYILAFIIAFVCGRITIEIIKRMKFRRT
jgi:hypothetical protein